ncbi:hypothetical protein K443DRAFT_678156 [Laccaria amethystina LaAM-08-1]|uniref:Uncharacterized protein n=1 Tax=Laccaria amethystina LaAM-08-1 TaxID=1095629 RepID=A0A0C9XJR7_9AGAR|nr:hypothetical protein K443DRAFT_678156 [Laccaria amethystina LaAM-08-1]
MRRNYLQIKKDAEAEGEIDENAQDILNDLEVTVTAGHQTALKMLVKLFNWLDTLEAQPTTEIMSLYEQSIKIDRSISGTLARMTQLAEKRGNLERLIRESDGIKLTVEGSKNFKNEITKKRWVYKDQSYHSTICSEPQCYSNCHVPCSLTFSIDPKGLRGCAAFWDSKNHFDYCRRSGCGHHMNKHRHYNSTWFHLEEKDMITDEKTKKRHEEATELLKNKEISIADVQKVIENTGKEMAEATEEIGRLAAKYSELSLSGSFSGQVKKSVRLLETHLEGIRNKSEPDSIKQIEASLDQLKNKLRVLEVAAEAAKNKISRPSIVVRLGQKAKDVLGL